MPRIVRIQARKKWDKSQYGDNWKKLREECLKRDGYKCVDCGWEPKDVTERKHLHPDHIIPFTRGGRNTLGNLRTRCADCHRRKTNRTRSINTKVDWSKKCPSTKKTYTKQNSTKYSRNKGKSRSKDVTRF